MADDRKQQGGNRDDSHVTEDELRREPGRDPEFEMPDPDQVDRDIDQAEKTHRKDEKDKNAA